MNKPATKEPSMDEILSSIRQIIADDDAPRHRQPPAVTAGCRSARSRPPAARRPRGRASRRTAGADAVAQIVAARFGQ